ncbi:MULTISPECIES: hypothetical protein [unclassified Microcoleus]|uniref:hypothetical protein n=1 Tax=unclassified Microcoleus TaxID=2642155 RepID=UPI002FCF5BC1
MKIDWNFIALLLTIATGIVSISTTLWKVSRLMLAKSKAQDARDQALYEGQKIQSAEIEDIIDYLVRDPATRGKFYRRKSLTKLKDNAFQDYEDEHTGFN